MSETAPGTDVIIGVDTHKLTHAAVAISALGARLGTMTIPASSTGYQALQAWARSLGPSALLASRAPAPTAPACPGS